MTATQVDVYVDQYAGTTFAFVYCQPLAGSNPPVPDPANPVNVTGYTASLTMRQSLRGRVLVELTDVSGIAVGSSNGTFTVTLTHAQTAQLVDGVYDLLVAAPAAEPVRIAQGRVIVSPGVTKLVV